MIKLGKAARTFIAIGITVIVYASLLMVYLGQNTEQSQLDQDLSFVQETTAKYSIDELASQKTELESELARLEPAFRVAETRLRQSIDSIDITDTLYELADSNDVDIVKIGSPSLTSKESEGITNSLLSVTMTVEGEVANLLDFILDLTDEFPTSAIESVTIDYTRSDRPFADLNLFLHTYEAE